MRTLSVSEISRLIRRESDLHGGPTDGIHYIYRADSFRDF